LYLNGKKVAVYECFFNIIKSAHAQFGHTRDPRKVYNHIKEEWYGVTEKACQIYISIVSVLQKLFHHNKNKKTIFGMAKKCFSGENSFSV
jgi:hypothetical protein